MIALNNAALKFIYSRYKQIEDTKQLFKPSVIPYFC